MPDLELMVSRVHMETASIRTLDLCAPDGGTLPAFTPGAHVQVHIPELAETRCYSLIAIPVSSAAADAGDQSSCNPSGSHTGHVAAALFDTPQTYILGVRLESPGRGGSRYMHDLAAGTRLRVSPPKNEFPLHPPEAGEKPVVLLAGGIGITPILSMVTALHAAGRPYVVHYSGRSLDQLAYLEVLSRMAGAAMVVHTDDDPANRLDIPALLDRYCAQGDPASHTYPHLYVCGPKGMIDAVIATAHQRGWPLGQVHFELFTTVAPQAGDQPFELELRQSGQVLTVPADKTMLEVMEAAGCDPMYDCKRGECGVCTATVLEGVPDHRDYFLSEAEKAEGKLIQICISRAKSPRLVLDL